jgi:outer membrane protein OmpA-like peptidoglycan-associated protein
MKQQAIHSINPSFVSALLVGIAAVSLLAGCSSTPQRLELLEQARSTVNQVDNDPLGEQVAGNELELAKQALARADRGVQEHYDLELIEHDAYLALRHAEIAEQRIEETRIREKISESEAERNLVLLTARERDAYVARSEAAANAREADRAQALALLKAQEADRNALEADRAKAQAASAIVAAQQLEQELEALKAEETERGLVLTLGDVLFDTDRAELKPGAQKTLDRLAGFLQDHDDRNLLIEGHTDSIGDDSYNLMLSSQRADAVRSALISRGIDPARLDANGLGEAFPVATNDSVAGRQENRRVEIIVSDQDGNFRATAMNTPVQP